MKRRKSNLLDALDRITKHTPSPFIAPIPSRTATTLFSLQENIPYFFTLQGEVTEGWYEITPTSSKTARISREAYPFEIVQYLDQLPRYFVIACFPTGSDQVLVVPFNDSDANQRGWRNGEPKVTYLVRHPNAIEKPFRGLIVRSLAGILLYDSESWDINQTRIHIDLNHTLSCNCGNDHEIPRNYQNAFNIVDKRYEELKREESLEQYRLSLLSTEEKMKFQLEFAGAKLHTWSELPNGYQITWEFGGRTFTQGFNKNLRCTVPGLCMYNTENFDLTAIVGAMQEAVQRNRPFFNEDYDEDD